MMLPDWLVYLYFALFVVGVIVVVITHISDDLDKRRIEDYPTSPEGIARREEREQKGEAGRGAMTAAEQDVLDKLVAAWNAFVQLPIEHPDQLAEFRHPFHDLQRQIMVRQFRRESKQ